MVLERILQHRMRLFTLLNRSSILLYLSYIHFVEVLYEKSVFPLYKRFIYFF